MLAMDFGRPAPAYHMLRSLLLLYISLRCAMAATGPLAGCCLATCIRDCGGVVCFWSWGCESGAAAPPSSCISQRWRSRRICLREGRRLLAGDATRYKLYVALRSSRARTSTNNLHLELCVPQATKLGSECGRRIWVSCDMLSGERLYGDIYIVNYIGVAIPNPRPTAEEAHTGRKPFLVT